MTSFTKDLSNFVLKSGARFPSVGLGTWKIPNHLVGNLVYESIRIGVRHLDCACDYGNEKEVGEGLQKAITEGICTRSDIFITSKLWNTYHAKDHVEIACKKSLNDMGVDYFDAYLIHFPISQRFVPFEVRYPPEWVFDPLSANPVIELEKVPISETWQGMEELVHKGLVRDIGVCNFSVQSLMDLLSYCTIPPSILQIELHCYLTQPALLSFCQSHLIHVTAFSPLGSSSYIQLGMDYGLGQGALQDPVIQRIATSINRTPAQVLLRWGVQRGVTVIPKSSQIERVRENIQIFDFTLTEEQMSAISDLNKNIRFNDPGEFCKGMGGAIPIYA
mmetsp:Transcript_6300/g.6510  ORF Transcript_6300/g.6510 Transcript_6300/m.6510 type:complete len:333 (+) Transcript_6300:70-1068(+)